MNFEAYRAIPAMNWSLIKHGAQSMRHLRHAIDNPDDGDTTSRGVLRAVHTAVLEPDRLTEDYAVFTGPRRAGKAWDEFELANAGRTILKASELEEVQATAASILACPEAAALIRAGRSEQSIQWTDPETGIACKGRLDLIGPGFIADLKGFNSTDADTFARQAGRMLYHCQAAWYQWGASLVTGEPHSIAHIVYEDSAPYDVAVFEMPEDWLDLGRKMNRDLLNRYARCLESGIWPGRYTGVQTLPKPPKYLGGE